MTQALESELKKKEKMDAAAICPPTSAKDAAAGDLAGPSSFPAPAVQKPAVTPFTDPRDIMKSWGGRKVKGFMDWGVGFGLNALMSGAIVYYINPNPHVKKFKDSLDKGGSSARRAIEILSAYISGAICTLIMSVVAPFQEDIAYKLNQWRGKDTDYKTKDMKLAEWKPKTIEEKIEYEISKRVNEKLTWKDVWKARLLGMAVILPGNEILGRITTLMENKTGHSIDTAAWKMGGLAYDALEKVGGTSLLDKANAWFSEHDASVDHIRSNVPDSYYRLEQVETKGHVFEADVAKAKEYSQAHNPAINETRVATREFFRTIFGVEIPWSAAMAGLVAKWCRTIQASRIARERKAAIDDLRAQGVVPAYYDSTAMLETRRDELNGERAPAPGDASRFASARDAESVLTAHCEKHARKSSALQKMNGGYADNITRGSAAEPAMGGV